MSKYLTDNDSLDDSLRWIKGLEEKNFPSNPTSKQLELFQNEIVQAGDSALAYFFATELMYKQYRMQKLILDQKDAKYAFMFARYVQNCDIKALQKVVMQSGKIKYITRFACHIRGANRKPLEKLIIQANKVKWVHEYLKHVKPVKIDRFKYIILSSGKPRYLFELAKHLTDPQDIKQVQDLIIASGSFTYMRLFATKIKTADVEKIERAVLDTENIEEIKKFARYVKKSKMRKFLLVM